MRAYLGWDAREAEAFHVCRYSIKRQNPDVDVIPLRQQDLRKQKLYWREEARSRDGVLTDASDHKPFSTEFSFTRFLVPHLQNSGWALYADSDFLFESDVAELFALRDPKYAVMVVKHDHAPPDGLKMDGVPQTKYRRKNWSSLILWNCNHDANKKLTLQDVNERPGSWLHAFEWLDESEIGSLPKEWNFLAGVDKTNREPNAIHYTLGIPALFPELSGVEMPYEDRWLAMFGRMHFDSRRIA